MFVNNELKTNEVDLLKVLSEDGEFAEEFDPQSG